MAGRDAGGMPVVPRRAAERDVEAAVDYLIQEAGPAVALAFIDALEAAYLHIAQMPASGSPRLQHELDIPGLRFWPVKGFRHLVFYRDTGDCIDIWRVLHSARDVPAWLADPDEG